MAYRIGIDTGGTFTDIVVVDDSGVITRGKVLSVPPEFEKGVMGALEVVARDLGTTVAQMLEQTGLFTYATTIGTNAIVTRQGAKTGLLITVGAEDTVHIARGMSKWAGLTETEIKNMVATRKPVPIVPKELIKGVIERIDWKGSVVCPLNVGRLKEDVRDLAGKGVESIAICFLWSPKNTAHEQEARQAVLEVFPEAYVSVSSEVAPVLGEYERANTTIMNAYVGPVMARYLKLLASSLAEQGLKSDLLLMKADGGCALSSELLPYATIGSGPAAGVIGAKWIGETLGYKDILTMDVGGTSFDVSLIKDGAVSYAREPVVDQYHVAYPVIDVTSIGAGGGSIAWADPATKVMHVGPQSAAANPGPACYGFGGVEPTVTDANLVLGYLNPDYFLGGRMKVYRDKAFAAVGKVADQLGMDVVQTAAGIYDIVNAHMADLVRGVTVQRGYDPRDFAVIAFGGAGPVHAAVCGAELGVKEVLIPFTASTYSAFGLVTSDILHTHSLFDFNPLPMDPDRFNRNFETLERKVSHYLDREGIEETDRTIVYLLDMRYGLQYHVVRVPVPRKRYAAEDMDFIASEFDRVYQGIYGKGAGYAQAGRFVVSFWVQGFGRTAKPSFPQYEVKTQDASGALKGKRDAFFRQRNGYVATNIYDYAALQAGNFIAGPAIMEASDTTIVVPPGQKADVDKYRNITIKVEPWALIPGDGR